uniref:Uncharacterized protein n=1 Tax=Setaria italica TaxID=4555 RepID=K3ZGQ0_SETIT
MPFITPQKNPFLLSPLIIIGTHIYSRQSACDFQSIGGICTLLLLVQNG